VNRGEIRWYTFRLPDKRRPDLLLARNHVADVLNEIMCRSRNATSSAPFSARCPTTAGPMLTARC
jgi:hypothetical protein